MEPDPGGDRRDAQGGGGLGQAQPVDDDQLKHGPLADPLLKTADVIGVEQPPPAHPPHRGPVPRRSPVLRRHDVTGDPGQPRAGRAFAPVRRRGIQGGGEHLGGEVRRCVGVGNPPGDEAECLAEVRQVERLERGPVRSDRAGPGNPAWWSWPPHRPGSFLSF